VCEKQAMRHKKQRGRMHAFSDFGLQTMAWLVWVLLAHSTLHLSVSHVEHSQGSDRATILLWDQRKEDSSVPHIIRTAVGECEVTYDRTRLADIDAAVFFMRYVQSVPPIRRPRGALWIMRVRESPASLAHRYEWFLTQMDFEINMYMSYEHFADIYSPFGVIASGERVRVPDTSFRARQGLIVAVISDCSASLRWHRLEALRMYLTIDVMGSGSCSSVPLDHSCKVRHSNQKACFQSLGTKYKFYFALENSDCEDYITEKVWLNAFEGNMIPVVWGTRAHYKTNLPPNSFINCAAFTTVSHCASFILAVAKNESHYQSFMSWKLNAGVHVREDDYDDICHATLRNRGRERPAVGVRALRDVNRVCSEGQT
jgi:hypothetical protein